MQMKMLTIISEKLRHFLSFFFGFRTYVENFRPNMIAHKLAEKLKENCSYSLMFMVKSLCVYTFNFVPLNFDKVRSCFR
jgi:hypothetical protein